MSTHEEIQSSNSKNKLSGFQKPDNGENRTPKLLVLLLGFSDPNEKLFSIIYWHWKNSKQIFIV